ncbi:MAG TPA: M20/M25/M40 family metallo-hydrolase [Saprospiraceae bacterium]|nr:M20/M25/M40 family metallo-hydrolase [Saprospiraceae bacterium]
MTLRFSLLTFISIFFVVSAYSQDEDVHMIRKIHDQALAHGKVYPWLSGLCLNHGGRIAGSPAYMGAANYTKDLLATIPGVKSYHQACEANYWMRGDKEVVELISNNGKKIKLNALSLGNSIATPSDGLMAEVIEVQSLDEVETLGREKIQGKIVFYNRPMDPTKIRTFSAYGGAVDQRVYGASKAAEYGAVAALVRSMTTNLDDFPHTGVLVYKDTLSKIPGLAISTNDAEMLSARLKEGNVKVYAKTNCRKIGLRPAPTVIGEIKGTEFPEEIIVVGGHLDSWDVGQGAHDDGAGCAQAMEVLRIFQAMDYKPKRTIRAVLFSNEENGLAGGRTYAEVSNSKKEFHLAALESDSGGFSPRGFSFEADTSVFKQYYRHVSQWLPLLESYGLIFEMGGSGADISPLKSQKGLLIGLRPDSQRYFDYHHTSTDTIDKVNKRELELGAAAMASLIYLIDKYGLK